MAAVVLTNVHKVYGHVVAVKDINLDIKDREFVVLVGPSGCGKSTTLRMIAGLEEISGGTIAIGGRVVNHLQPKDRDIAMVFQNYALYQHMSVRDNLAFGLRNRRVPEAEIAAAVSRAARILSIEPLLDRRPYQLSGGQQQRVAIARSLAMRPDVMLFDEVTAALDPETIKEVLTTIKEVAAEGMTCILVTHEMGFAREVADHVYFTDGGLIVEHGPASQFFANANDPRTRQFLSQVL